jgi:hypothetical protein
MITPTEYRVDLPDFAKSSCFHVRWNDGAVPCVIIQNEFDTLAILVDEWQGIAEAVYKLMEDHG